MMNSMRGFASGVVSKILMLFLVVSFGVWGIGDIFRSGVGGYAARVGDETISVTDFQRQRNAIGQQMERMGANINVQALNATVLRQLVQQKLVMLAMGDLGLFVNEELLSKTLRAEPAFQNPDGSFSSASFRTMLKAQNITEGEVLKQIKDEVAGNFLVSSLDMVDVVPPAPVRTLIDTAARETRDAWIVSIASLPAPKTVDDSALKDFYEKNKSMLYMQPETRTIDYITLRPAQLDQLVNQSSDKDENGVKTARADKRDRVLRDLQNSIDDALAGGATLSEALKKAGLNTAPHTLSNVVNTLAQTSTDDATKTVAEQGFQMSEGETSGIIMTKQGTPVIVHVESVHPAKAQDYDVVQNDVHERVIEQLRREATRTRVQEVKQALNQLASSEPKQWQSVLDRFSLSATRVTGLKRPTAGKAVENGIPASLRQSVFEHQLGGVAGPLSLESGAQMLAIVTKINHPAPLTAEEKNTPEREKHLKEMSQDLNQTVQMRAFTSLAEKHPVRVNPQALSAGTQSEQAQ